MILFDLLPTPHTGIFPLDQRGQDQVHVWCPASCSNVRQGLPQSGSLLAVKSCPDITPIMSIDVNPESSRAASVEAWRWSLYTEVLAFLRHLLTLDLTEVSSQVP